jgi:hypothetical protein
LSVQPAAFAGHEVGHVDRFLDIAARFLEHLAHLARHVARERLLAVGQQLRGAKQQLGATRRRHEPPLLVGAACGVDRALNVLAGRLLEHAHQLVRVGGITVLEEIA